MYLIHFNKIAFVGVKFKESNVSELKKQIIRTDKFAGLELSEVDGKGIGDVILHIMKLHESLEEHLQEGEWIELREYEQWGETHYEWCVYKLESDESYNKRVQEFEQVKQQERERDLAILKKLSKKYPEIKIEL